MYSGCGLTVCHIHLPRSIDVFSSDPVGYVEEALPPRACAIRQCTGVQSTTTASTCHEHIHFMSMQMSFQVMLDC